MSLSSIAALINVLTLAILLAGAVAAMIQFSYVRAGNQLRSILAVEQSFNEPDLQRALLYVQHELAQKLMQPGYRAELAARGYIDPRAHPEMAVCNWFNEMGMMVAGGFLSERVIMDSFGRLVEHYWRLLRPAIGVMRRDRDDGQYASFAALAERAQRWRRDGRVTAYPAGLARLPLIDPWAEIDRHDTAVRG